MSDDESMYGTDLEEEWRNNAEQFQSQLDSGVDVSLASLYDAPEHVTADNQELITNTASQMVTLRNLDPGDQIVIETTNSSETIRLELVSISTRSSKQNEVYEFTDVEKDRNIHIVFDYEGAYTSIVPVYVPYVTAVVIDGISLGDVETLTVE